MSRASDQLHKDRMYAKGWKALILSGLTPAQAHKSMRALIASIGRACPVCTYMHKSRTGENIGDFEALDGLEKIAANRQRDGDNGDEKKRLRHALLIADTLYDHPMGLTDEEIWIATGIKSSDSAKGARAGLARGGWTKLCSVRNEDGKIVDKVRMSQYDCAMKVWILTGTARSEMSKVMSLQTGK